MSDRKQNGAIDLCKFVFAVMIVLMHADLLSGIRNGYRIQITLFALAVPFFFVTSGYFLGLKLNKVDNTLDQKVIVKSSLKRFLRLYLLFGGWYFICDVIKTVAISHNKVSDLLYYVT